MIELLQTSMSKLFKSEHIKKEKEKKHTRTQSEEEEEGEKALTQKNHRCDKLTSKMCTKREILTAITINNDLNSRK